jgi:hypothetical protein
MKQDQDSITRLISQARARHLWLRSNDDKDVWLTPGEADAVGEALWLSPAYLLGFVLADPHLLLDKITDDIEALTLKYEQIQARIAAG